MNTACMTIQNLHDELARGSRVLLMTRHAERPHIDPEDPTFGETLPITENGRHMAEELGRSLRTPHAVQFMSSPLRRTRMTAACIAAGMGLSGRWSFDTIPTDPLIGNDSFYYADVSQVWQLFRGGEFYRPVIEYCTTGMQTGFRELHAATDMLEKHVADKFTAQLGIFTTHDLFIAAFLSARDAAPEWSEENWVGFCDSAAIVIAPDSSRRYALVKCGS